MPDNSIGGTLDVHVASRGGAKLFKIQILALSRAHIRAKSRYYSVPRTPPKASHSAVSHVVLYDMMKPPHETMELRFTAYIRGECFQFGVGDSSLFLVIEL
ncbi:hypothetical protein FOIG_10810 [Fusarium odoratissimum NRRL 54006]|uniref:Uncharacterized protein n=2 Tax=Fusarium oxysporum species complex TaxID=171631 RepID=X0KJU1_FUSO5|nr:uncharacterized protein FOIG_10810 [Fusarium odoratissimum NRRL 54006]XP_031059229.1 uncharacterized protein FOIG_10810 [Fusarium odoratissimum NRRL 54006]EXL97138.1 hypothetical protein FOIG_10810 [Fusarium odoratissimum NRRL 54006]EXL97139.1 hypothetical protein FOIG_10810 [Fusarium odoratissimum NRRL 54006]TXC00757.1 hypothetical protein FocTR4_00009033 [Fusarium oxysporum f. sp. cubense]